MLSKNLISINDISKSEILEIFDLADYSSEVFSKHKLPLRGYVLGSFFFQSSTRTQFSFQSSFVKLGGSYLGCNNRKEIRCSYPYYESMDDFAKIISNYCDIIVMRSDDEEEMKQFIESAEVPVISAGCGKQEHPTQAILDLYTINKLLGRVSNISLLIIGTPSQRTINSLLLGLNLWENVEVLILCQEGDTIEENIKKQLNNVSVQLFSSWHDLIYSGKLLHINIVYVGEIYYDVCPTNYYTLNDHILKNYFSPNVIILSPLPRTNELSKEIDCQRGAKYFWQAKKGLNIRAGIYLKYFK